MLPTSKVVPASALHASDAAPTVSKRPEIPASKCEQFPVIPNNFLQILGEPILSDVQHSSPAELVLIANLNQCCTCHRELFIQDIR
ncbi:hypothetical protein NL676_033907 [Syzygium grande]|nr:hypothetical protein NL676_033907 [Syzygium grande]